jgi:hypothetical protein
MISGSVAGRLLISSQLAAPFGDPLEDIGPEEPEIVTHPEARDGALADEAMTVV